jgi:hypothetical protein
MDLKVLHFILAGIALFIFSKLSFDAVVLGAIALVLYSQIVNV